MLIPSIALLVMWTGLSAYFIGNGFYIRAVASSVQDVSIPAVKTLGGIQQERQLSLIYLERPTIGPNDLHAQQQVVDNSMSVFRGAMNDLIGSVPDEIGGRMTELAGYLDRLPVIRADINSKSINAEQANNFYNQLMDTARGLFDVQARIVPDATATQGALDAMQTFQASDQMSRAASAISSAFASGSLSPQNHLTFAQMVSSYHANLDRVAPFMDPEVGKRYQTLADSDQWKRLSNIETALINTPPGPLRDSNVGVSESDWLALTTQVSTELTELTAQQADHVNTQALDNSNSNFRNALLGSIATLIVALAAIIVALRVSRTLADRTVVTRLQGLRDASLELARTRLPSIVDRLRGGDEVDIKRELPGLDYGTDEIGEVAQAINAAQFTAVSAAASEARARSGLHNVFLGISYRSQSLVNRQLQILDEMESREENGKQLERLFQLDHLATRMRRTVENLIILGGEQPGRRWRSPVPISDVVRSAVSETENYARVDVDTSVPDVSIAGAAVNDVIHLLAELVDNATTFSPKDSKVHMSSRRVARGVMVDVADEGLGMPDDRREWANRMMANPPEFDAMALKAHASLGLFVVARLATRLGITVTFGVSRFGGTMVTVIIPTSVLVTRDQNGNGNGNGNGSEPSTPAQISSTGHVHQSQQSDESRRFSEQQQPTSTETPTVMIGDTTDANHGDPAHSHLAMRTSPQAQPTQPAAPRQSASAAPQQVAAATRQQPSAPDELPELPQRQPQTHIAPELLDDPDTEADTDNGNSNGNGQEKPTPRRRIGDTLTALLDKDRPRRRGSDG